MSHYGVIAGIHKESLAEELGLEIGDRILSVNGQELMDIIDLSFAFAEEEIELLIEKANGEQELIEFDKEYDEELGVEFESAVFDNIRRCGNKCWFCFVDQIAPNMRDSLSIKDDDYRMSFLYGNFVTLTNIREMDLKRIKQLHLSPLFISVHTTNGQLRARMLNNKRAANIIEQLEYLVKNDIQIHTQIVLCPGINDGEILDQTIHDLINMGENVLSLAIVPVGLTEYRESCYSLTGFSMEQAGKIIEQVEKWQLIARKKFGKNFVYLGDEFYFLANQDIPDADYYDDFPQLENGIGLTRDFIEEWNACQDKDCNAYEEPIYLDIVCGKSAEKILSILLRELEIKNLFIRVIPIENKFFGENITVTGLLTGQDIIQQLKFLSGKRDGIIIPGVSLRKGENIFLDDYHISDIEKELGAKVQIAHDAVDLNRLLKMWNNVKEENETEDMNYTWQGNCAYTKNN